MKLFRVRFYNQTGQLSTVKIMKLLKKYILFEHFKPFVFGLLIFVFILFMGNMGDIVRMMAARTDEFLNVLIVLANILVYVASFSIPMACLLSVLLAIGRLNSDNEITAVRACGLNPAGLMRPVILLTILISLLSVNLNTDIVPLATTRTEKLMAEIAQREPSMFIQERMLIEDFEGHIIYIQRKKNNSLYGVQITQIREVGFPVNITSREGEILDSSDPGKLMIKLTNGTVDEADHADPYTYSRSTFNEYHIVLHLPDRSAARIRRRPKDMTASELGEKAKEMTEMNMDASPLITEINRKYAQAFSPLPFVLIAIPLSLKIKRGGKSVGFGMCLLIVVLYYVLFTAAQTFGERGILNELIVWAPNVLLTSAGLILLATKQ